MYSTESLFSGQIFKSEILAKSHFWDVLYPKFTTLAAGLFFSPSLTLRVFAFVVAYLKNKKQQKLQIWNSTLLLHICYLKLFMTIRQIVCEQGNTKDFEHITAYGRNFLSGYFNLFRQHKIGRNEYSILTWSKICNEQNMIRITFITCLYKNVTHITTDRNFWKFISNYFMQFFNELNK